MHIIESIIDFAGFALEIAIILVWFYGYIKTKVRGFALIGFAIVLRFLFPLSSLFLFNPNSLNIRDIFYTFQISMFVVNVTSFLLMVWGIMSIIDRLRRDKT